MRYLLISYDDEAAWERAGETAHRDAIGEAIAITHRLDAKGQYLSAAPLQPSSEAKTVRLRDGRPHITDGPFAESHEVIGGFYLIDVPTIEDAVRVAQQHPGLRYGAVEIRRILEIEGLPKPRL